jgi:hypothetical protein
MKFMKLDLDELGSLWKRKTFQDKCYDFFYTFWTKKPILSFLRKSKSSNRPNKRNHLIESPLYRKTFIRTTYQNPFRCWLKIIRSNGFRAAKTVQPPFVHVDFWSVKKKYFRWSVFDQLDLIWFNSSDMEPSLLYIFLNIPVPNDLLSLCNAMEEGFYLFEKYQKGDPCEICKTILYLFFANQIGNIK